MEREERDPAVMRGITTPLYHERASRGHRTANAPPLYVTQATDTDVEEEYLPEMERLRRRGRAPSHRRREFSSHLAGETTMESSHQRRIRPREEYSLKIRSFHVDVCRLTLDDVVLTRTRSPSQDPSTYLKVVFARVRRFASTIVYFEDPWENSLFVKKADWRGIDVLGRIFGLLYRPRGEDDEDLLRHILSSTPNLAAVTPAVDLPRTVRHNGLHRLRNALLQERLTDFGRRF